MDSISDIYHSSNVSEMTASKALETAVDVIAVISDTLPLNEAAFVAPELQLIQWCKVSTT